MDFAKALIEAATRTKTENGANALNTTGDACLDLFGTIGALRTADALRIQSLFDEAYREDKLLATKIAFYARDVRGGLGERRTFREIIRHMAMYHPEALIPNLDLIGVFGRYDDLYSLIDTPAENQMWTAMKNQFEEDRANLAKGNAISLLAKWIKSADASSQKTRQLGVLTAEKLGYDVYRFKRIVRAMRKHIGIVESLMSAGRWDEIKYPEVPSRAMMIYRNAFRKHDPSGFEKFAQKALTGETKINSSTLYPYDLVEKITGGNGHYVTTDDPTIEAQWRQLPNYVEPGINAIVMADTSGSMFGRPLCSAVGLAIYFAERNIGAYHNLWMTFSSRPIFHNLRGDTLAQKLRNLDKDGWDMNTDLRAAFYAILELATAKGVSPEEMPKSLIVISDMEIDECGNRDWTFYDKMQRKFRNHGYEIPNVIFWNVNSRHNVFHADSTRKGVQLCSGQSTTVFKQLLSCIGMTPVEAMLKTINSERYDCIKIG